MSGIAEPRSDDEDRSQTAGPAATYRCVCGATFAFDGALSGDCTACGRHFSADVLLAAGAETLDIESLSSDPSTIPPPPGAAGPDPQVGEELDHFSIVQRLGHGGMGTVYRALDESLQRYVALKVIRAGSRNEVDSSQMESLQQEARAQARVNHPHVVHIYYVGRDERSPFFAMELVTGPTLAERLEAGPLPFVEVIEIALQLTSALDCAAKYDIVHGDVKPSNVLQVDPGTVKLSDFGLARRLSQELDGTSGVVGTPNYLSPEAVRGEPLDIKSDMYSLGVAIFEMTFGRLPYELTGSTLSEKLQVHETAPIDFPEPWPATVPEGFRHVLRRLMAKEPAGRYGDYDDLRRDLERLRPVSLPRAGRVPRALAWLLDLVLVTGLQALLWAPFAAAGGVAVLDRHPGLRLFYAAFGALAPFAALCLQAWWGTTPGKALFQIRIVDRHCLRPNRTILALRSIVQFFPLWAGPAGSLYTLFGLEPIAAVVFLTAAGVLLIDAMFAALAPGGRSLHDLAFGTQVVLDAGARR
jgi:hypothetical protein